MLRILDASGQQHMMGFAAVFAAASLLSPIHQDMPANGSSDHALRIHQDMPANGSSDALRIHQDVPASGSSDALRHSPVLCAAMCCMSDATLTQDTAIRYIFIYSWHGLCYSLILLWTVGT